MMMHPFMLSPDELATVQAGADDFGRCGPGSSIKARL
jgi:hypothetical protein